MSFMEENMKKLCIVGLFVLASCSQGLINSSVDSTKRDAAARTPIAIYSCSSETSKGLIESELAFWSKNRSGIHATFVPDRRSDFDNQFLISGKQIILEDTAISISNRGEIGNVLSFSSDESELKIQFTDYQPVMSINSNLRPVFVCKIFK